MKTQIAARLEELRQIRLQESIRAAQLQNEFNKAVASVHQHDGAIAAYEELLKTLPPETT